MPDIKNKISDDLQKAKAEGELRTERIREIVRAAVSGATSEFREGSTEIRSIVKDAVSAVIENLRDRGKETRDEISASIEGAIEGISSKKREAIAEAQERAQQLQSSITSQEKELQEQIDSALTDLETTTSKESSSIQEAIESVTASLRDSEEINLMRKRYAQLQSQLAILKANLTLRYGDRYDEAKRYLDDAKTWYKETQEQAETQNDGREEWVQTKQSKFEDKMSEAGTALAQKERQVRQILKELWHSATDLTNNEK